MAAVKAKRPTKAPSKKLKAAQKKKMNKWLILGGVAAVAIIGAVVVRFSSASTRTFTRPLSQLRAGEGLNTPTKVIFKNVTYAKAAATNRNVSAREPKSIKTIVSGAEYNRSSKICAHVVNTSSKYSVYPTLMFGNVDAARYVEIKPKSTKTICGTASGSSNGLKVTLNTNVYIGSNIDRSGSSIGVNEIYGVR